MSTDVLDVLIAESDDEVRSRLASELKAAGFPVRTAANGQEAIALSDQKHPRILIADWRMCDANGACLCHHFREQTLSHYIYVVLTCDTDDVASRIAGLGSGADDFVNKSVGVWELLARLKAGERIFEIERRLLIKRRPA